MGLLDYQGPGTKERRGGRSSRSLQRREWKEKGLIRGVTYLGEAVGSVGISLQTGEVGREREYCQWFLNPLSPSQPFFLESEELGDVSVLLGPQSALQKAPEPQAWNEINRRQPRGESWEGLKSFSVNSRADHSSWPFYYSVEDPTVFASHQGSPMGELLHGIPRPCSLFYSQCVGVATWWVSPRK